MEITEKEREQTRCSVDALRLLMDGIIDLAVTGKELNCDTLLNWMTANNKGEKIAIYLTELPQLAARLVVIGTGVFGDIDAQQQAELDWSEKEFVQLFMKGD